MGVDFPERRVLAKRAVDGRKPASGHESQLRQGVASGHPEGRSAAKEPRSGLTRRNTLTLDPTCCGFSHSLFAIYARLYAAVNRSRQPAVTTGSRDGTLRAPDHRRVQRPTATPAQAHRAAESRKRRRTLWASGAHVLAWILALVTPMARRSQTATAGRRHEPAPRQERGATPQRLLRRTNPREEEAER